MLNPFAEKELGRLQAESLDKGNLAKQLSEQKEKLNKTFESGELNRQTGLGKAVNDLEDYVLQSTNKELHNLSFEEVDELIKKFDLPYDKEAIKMTAEIFAAQRKKESH